MALDKVVAAQLVKGAMDSSLFENFVYSLLASLSQDPELRGRHIVLYLDNARIHKVDQVVTTARRFGCTVLFAAQYTPHCMPIETLFNLLKRDLRDQVLKR